MCTKHQALIKDVKPQATVIYSTGSLATNTSNGIPQSGNKNAVLPVEKTASAPTGPLEHFTIPASDWQDQAMALPAAPPPYYATLPPGHTTEVPNVWLNFIKDNKLILVFWKKKKIVFGSFQSYIKKTGIASTGICLIYCL